MPAPLVSDAVGGTGGALLGPLLTGILRGYGAERCQAQVLSRNPMNEPDPKFLSDFFDTQKIKVRRCFAPPFNCTQSAIRAHSIQNSRVMDLIHENGKVFVMKMHARLDRRYIQLDLVGRNEASNFTGLCSDHDASIFRAIDNSDFDPSDLNHLFLVAYRSVLREFHSLMEGATKLQSSLIKAVEEGKLSPDVASVPMMVATEAMMRSYAFYKYRVTNFDQAYMTSDFSSVTHDVAIFEGQEPTIAASTFSSLKPVIDPSGFVGIVINVIPMPGNRMAAVFSYASSEAGAARASLNRVLTSVGPVQKYELSKHLLAVTENFVLNPKFVGTWSAERRAAIVSAFETTIGAANPDVGENEGYMLF